MEPFSQFTSFVILGSFILPLSFVISPTLSFFSYGHSFQLSLITGLIPKILFIVLAENFDQTIKGIIQN